MINLALQSGYSFRKTFGFIPDLVKSGQMAVGLADVDNTYGHFYLQQECKKKGVKPIFGVRVMAVKNAKEKIPPRGQFGPRYILLAKNQEGLREIYSIVSLSTQLFYYRPHVGLVDIWGLSDNVIVIAESFDIAERIDYIGVSFNTPKHILEKYKEIPRVAINSNRWQYPDDKKVYEAFLGNDADIKTHPGHILSEEEWMANFNDREAVENTYRIAEMCNAELKSADPVKYLGNETLENLCIQGAIRNKIDLKNEVYRARLEREIKLIDEKGFRDYFMVVSEMIMTAKKRMLVGPARGSAGGSLVCFLTGITEIDPIKYDLLFERFLAPDRMDMPDIDTDFPHLGRPSVIRDLIRINGEDKIAHIGTVSQMQARSVLGETAKNMGVPVWDAEAVADTIPNVTSGDIRYGRGIDYAFKETDIGIEFLKMYPNMEIATRLENHPRHTGIHAAGVIVSKNEIVNFSAIDLRSNTVMLEGKSAEALGMLKMDVLGLSTLTVLEETARMAGFDFRKFYELETNDDNVFKVFRELRLRGIFQFEGYALQNLCRGIKVRSFDDIVAITALARPGPLHGGAAKMFSEIHQGKEEMKWLMDHDAMRKITAPTLGTIVYQEQLMSIMKEIGHMSWEDVGKIRKVVAKKQGKEYFDKFREIFLLGTRKENIPDEIAIDAWEKMLTFGAYGFNKSHAVAYGLVSYWTAWAKCYYPLEYAAASMNCTTEDSALKILREIHLSDGIEYEPVNKDHSDVYWSIHNGKLIGGLTNIHGVGAKKAEQIIKARKTGAKLPPSLISALENPTTPFDSLFPCYDKFKIYYDSGIAIPIEKIKGKGEFQFIGLLLKKNLRDLNELVNVQKRGGEIYTEDTFLLNITVEDDTDCIMCRIGRKDFERIGKDVSEDGVPGKDYYLIKGATISDEVRFIFIREIHKLGEEE